MNKLEQLTSNLLLVAAPVLTSAEHAEVQKFIKVNEYGLALEVMVDILTEEKKTVSEELIAAVQKAAEAMDIDHLPLLLRLSDIKK